MYIHIYFQMDIVSEWIVRIAQSLRTGIINVKMTWGCWRLVDVVCLLL